MELILNLAWVACSLGLILFWLRNSASNPVPRKTQVLALAVVVLLLLPVISLSDDLMAMQGLAETDSSARRAGHLDAGGTPVAPASAALPLGVSSEPQTKGDFPVRVAEARLSPPLPALTRSLDRRPPPQV